MRIRVADILDLLSASLDSDRILDEMPDLKREDINAALNSAKQSIDHPVSAT